MKVFVISSIVVLISIVILSTSSNVESIPIDRVIIKDSAGNQITPVLNKEVFFHYNVQNYGNQSQTYDLDISINDEDTNLPIFHKKMQLILEPDERKPIVWSFTPTTYGNYSAKITKNEITIGSSFSISDYSKSNKTIFPLHGNQKYQIMAPLKQLQYGLALDQVQCKQNLVLIQKYDDSPDCVTESTKTKLIERGWTKNENTLSKINKKCMTIEQSKQIAPFFKTPTYLPDGYSHVCTRSGMPFESYMVYYNQEFPPNWNMPELVSDGAIFIYQLDERPFVGDKEFQTYGSPEQRVRSTYDHVMEVNPSLNPQLITINGMLAYAVDSCNDCGIQTANFTDGTIIQKSTSSETRIKFYDENGVTYLLETTLPLSELIKVAESFE